MNKRHLDESKLEQIRLLAITLKETADNADFEQAQAIDRQYHMLLDQLLLIDPTAAGLLPDMRPKGVGAFMVDLKEMLLETKVAINQMVTYLDTKIPSKVGIRRCFKVGIKGCPKKTEKYSWRVFIGMSFREENNNIYENGILPALEGLNLFPWKADEELSNIDIMCKICQAIQESEICIFEVSDWNPNVLFELGLAYGLGKAVIMVKKKGVDVPIDLRGIEYLEYERAKDLKGLITRFFMSNFYIIFYL